MWHCYFSKIHKYFFHYCLTLNICQGKKRNRSIDRTACAPYNHPTLQSPDSCTSSSSTVCPLRHFSSFPFHFPCIPITNQPDRVHFSPLRGWMKIKKHSKMDHARHRLLWFMMAGSLAVLCSLGSSPARLLLPQPSNGELQSARSDTVKPSGTADYGAKYWSLPLMCQNSPHPLIRISPSRHTGTNRIY